MPTETRSRPTKVYLGRIIALYVLLGVMVAVLSHFVQDAVGIHSDWLGGFLFGLFVVSSAPILNWLGRKRRIPWLVKYE